MYRILVVKVLWYRSWSKFINRVTTDPEWDQQTNVRIGRDLKIDTPRKIDFLNTENRRTGVKIRENWMDKLHNKLDIDEWKTS